MTPDPALIARLFDATHLGVEGDLLFYRARCPAGTSILELGCGSGRLLEALSDDRTLVGVDTDPHRLALAKARCPDHVELLEGDMRTFQDRRRFDRVIIALNGLYGLPEAADLKDAMKTVARHLNPDGLFICDVYPSEELDEEAREAGPGPHDDDAEYVFDIEVDGTTYEVYEENHWHPKERQIQAVFTYVADPEEPAFEVGITHFYRSLQELLRVAREAGLELVEQWHRFPSEENDDDAEPVHALAFKPSRRRGRR